MFHGSVAIRVKRGMIRVFGSELRTKTGRVQLHAPRTGPALTLVATTESIKHKFETSKSDSDSDNDNSNFASESLIVIHLRSIAPKVTELDEHLPLAGFEPVLFAVLVLAG